MTELEKLREWIRFIRASGTSYKLNALKAVYESDGEGMLRNCLKELGWLDSVDFIKQIEAKELIR